MPSPQSTAIDEIRRSSAEIRRDLDTVYASIRRGKFTDRKRITAERRIKSKLDELTRRSQKFYEDTLHLAYLSGAQAVKDGYTLKPDDMKLLASISDDGMTKIATSNELAKRGIFRWGEVAEGSQWRGAARRNNVKGMITADGRRYHPDTYRTLVMAADAARTYNFGVLAGAEDAGVELVIIRDGNGCGLRSHNDPEEANGKVMTLDEARAYPIAHPYCQRTFEPYHGDRKPGSKTRSLAKTSAKVVGVGAVAAVAGVVTLKASKTLQERLTLLVARANPQFLEYRARVLQTAAATRRQFDEITAELREEMEAWAEDETHQLSERARQLLGVNSATPRRIVGDMYEDVFEFERFSVMGQEDIDIMNSIGGHTLASIIDDSGGRVSWQLPKAFVPGRSIGATVQSARTRASGRVGRDLGGSFSRELGDKIRVGASRATGSDTVVRYVNFHPNQLVRYRLSRVSHGVANSVILNPNGVLRAGFRIDPKTGLISPSLRFLPRGPIRIFNEVNRGSGTAQTGDLLGRKIERVLNNKRVIIKERRLKNQKVGDPDLVRDTRVVRDGPTLKDILRRGNPASPGFLKNDDFVSGSVQNLLYDPSDGTIRRGVIRDALSIVDPKTGKRVAVDLMIRNGKFVREHMSGRGLVTSVSTTVQINVYRSLKFNIRTNLNLRALGLSSFSDLRHMPLSALTKINPARHFRIVSMSLQLKMFGYSIWEIGKILRIGHADLQRIWRDTLNLMDASYRKALWQKYEQVVAAKIGGPGTEELTREVVQQRLLSLPKEVADQIRDVPALLADSARALKREWVDDPIKWVFGSVERAKRLRETVEVTYKRPKNVTYIEDFEGGRTDVGPGARIHLSRKETDDLFDLTNPLYLSPEELADVLKIDLQEAIEMQERAMIVLEDDMGRTRDIIQNLIRGYSGKSPRESLNLGMAVSSPELERMYAVAQKDWPTTAARPAALVRDIEATMAFMEAEFPNLSPVKLRFIPVFQGGTTAGRITSTNAEYVRWFRLDTKMRKLIDEGHIPASVLDEDLNDDEIWIHQPGINNWMRANPRSGWHVSPNDVNGGQRTFIHEYGHHVHMSVDLDDHPEFEEKLYDILFYSGPDPADDFHEWVQNNSSWIKAEIGSEYATTNFFEFMAETFTYAVMWPGQSAMADSIYRLLKEVWS